MRSNLVYRKRPFDFYAGGGGAGMEDVFGPGHFFFTRDAVLSSVYNTICTIEFNLS